MNWQYKLIQKLTHTSAHELKPMQTGSNSECTADKLKICNWNLSSYLPRVADVHRQSLFTMRSGRLMWDGILHPIPYVIEAKKISEDIQRPLIHNSLAHPEFRTEFLYKSTIHSILHCAEQSAKKTSRMCRHLFIFCIACYLIDATNNENNDGWIIQRYRVNAEYGRQCGGAIAWIVANMR